MSRQRLITVLTLSLACWLALGGTVLAKGPTGLTIDGPGLGESIEIRGVSESCRSGVCTELLEAVGFFQLVFDVKGENQATPAIDRIPEGPVYVLTWDMGVDIPMDVYPFADGGPLVHIAPGLYEERAHSQSFEVPGGWFRADAVLLDLLSAYGVHLNETAIPSILASRCSPIRSRLWYSSSPGYCLFASRDRSRLSSVPGC